MSRQLIDSDSIFFFGKTETNTYPKITRSGRDSNQTYESQGTSVTTKSSEQGLRRYPDSKFQLKKPIFQKKQIIGLFVPLRALIDPLSFVSRLGYQNLSTLRPFLISKVDFNFLISQQKKLAIDPCCIKKSCS